MTPQQSLEDRVYKALKAQNPDRLREFLRSRADIQEIKKKLGPQTKEEFWQWFKDRVDIELSRVAVCPGHSSQLDMAWELYNFEVMRILWVMSRGGGKTSLAAWVDDCQAEHWPGWASFTIGANRTQGDRKYEYLLPLVVEGGVIGGKELPHVERSIATKTQYKNKSSIEIALGSSPENANGPRTPRLHRDETELMQNDTYKQAGNIPAGRKMRDGRYAPAQILDTSTMKHAGGRIDTLMKEYDKAKKAGMRPRMEVRVCCFVPETLVRTTYGLCSISEIKTGDYVLSEGGVYREVTHVWQRQHDGPIRVLRTSAGQAVRLTPEHPIAAVFDDRLSRPAVKPRSHRVGGYSEQWVRVDHLVVGSYVRTEVLQRQLARAYVEPPLSTMGELGDGRSRHAHPSYALTPDFFWAIGLFIAEGCRTTGGISFSLHADEREYEQRLRNTFEPLGFTVSRYEREEWGRGVQIVVHSRQLRDWWPAWLGSGCDNKVIPPELMDRPLDQLQHVIQGILDGDGSEHWSALCQTSARLATQVVEASLRGGGRATITIAAPREGRKQVYTVNNPDAFVAIAPGRVTSTAVHQRPRGYWQLHDKTYVKVVQNDIEHYEGDVYDLSIDGEPSFVVENMLVHNCIYEVARENPACRCVSEDVRRARLIELRRDPSEICNCDTYESDVWPSEDGVDEIDSEVQEEPRTLESVCQGRFFRSRGYKAFDDIQTLFLENERESWNAEQECSEPSREGTYLKSYNHIRHGILGYEPDPENGLIYRSVDWGADDEHAVIWWQILDRDVRVRAYIGDSIKTLRAGAVVAFAEIFRAGIGNTALGKLVIEKESEWIMRYPGWRVHECYPDNANLGARLDWRDELGLETTSRIRKDFGEELKLVRSRIGNRGRFYVDVRSCPMFDQSIKAWRQVNGREVHDQSSHPMACFRYFEHNIHVVERELKKLGHSTSRPAAADDAEERALEREVELAAHRRNPLRAQDGGAVTMLGAEQEGPEDFGIGGADDSPIRRQGSRMGSEADWRSISLPRR